MLTESAGQTLSAFGPHRVRPAPTTCHVCAVASRAAPASQVRKDHFKGLPAEEVAAVYATQAAQREELAARK